MAKILFGVGVADARGKLGGHVFSKNRFGAYIRQKVSPSQPRSASQMEVRAAFGGFSKSWTRDLDDSQRQGWISLAASIPRPDKFGNPQVLTGLQMYQSVNRNLGTIAKQRMDNPPNNLQVQAPATVSLVATVAGDVFTVSWTPQTLDPHMHIAVDATPPMSAGKSFFGPFLSLLFADPNDSSGAPLDLFTAYHDAFGQLQEGQRIGVDAYIINDLNGAASVAAVGSAICSL